MFKPLLVAAAVSLMGLSSVAQAQTLYDMQRDQQEMMERQQDQLNEMMQRQQDQMQQQMMQPPQPPSVGSLFVPNNRGGNSIIGGGLFGH